MILTLQDMASILGVKNSRAVLRLKRMDPTLPIAKKGKRWLGVESDLEEWVRRDYSDAAKQALEVECTSDETRKPGNEKAIGTSPFQELEHHLARRTKNGRRRLSTGLTPKLGIVNTAS